MPRRFESARITFRDRSLNQGNSHFRMVSYLWIKSVAPTPKWYWFSIEPPLLRKDLEGYINVNMCGFRREFSSQRRDPKVLPPG